jgi:hypothetical protein
MRWAEHEACVGEMRNAYKILGRKPFGDFDINGRIALRMQMAQFGVQM